MGYKIRYGPPRWRERPGWYDWRFQVMTAVVLLGSVLLLREDETARRLLTRWLTVGSESGLERALAAMSNCVAGGEGWYHGAVMFGRTILGG